MKKILFIFILSSVLLTLIKEPILAKDINSVDKEVINKIDKFVQENMDKNNINGVILSITKGDQIYYSTGYGIASNKSKITNKTLMPIASLSKSFTALAILKLSEEYNIDIDQTYMSFFPELNVVDNHIKDITIRQLINHTSGLSDKVNPDMTRDPQFKSLEDVNKSLENIYLEYDPGTKYNYHNPNYQFLACLIEKISGLKFEDYLKEKIFLPLKMNDTFAVKSTSEFNNHQNITKGHYILFGVNREFIEPNWFISGPAGIVSNAKDMAKWLLEKRYISILKNSENKALFHQTGEIGAYGTGHSIYEDNDFGKIISSSGIFWGYKSEQVLLIEKDVSVTMTFDTGLNPFINYTLFTKGVVNIILNKPNSNILINNTILEILILVIIILIYLSTYFRLKGYRKLIEKGSKRSKRSIVFSAFFSIVFTIILLLFPNIITFVGAGRVIPLTGIWTSMPSIVILLLTMLLSCILSFIYKVKVYFK